LFSDTSPLDVVNSYQPLVPNKVVLNGLHLQLSLAVNTLKTRKDMPAEHLGEYRAKWRLGSHVGDNYFRVHSATNDCMRSGYSSGRWLALSSLELVLGSDT
jgi:hypothetical protein